MCIRDRSLGVPVAYTAVANTWSTLVSLTARIGDDQDSLAAQGVNLSSWGPNVLRNRVVVTLAQYSESAATAVYARYGSDLVYVTPQSPSGPNVEFSGRYGDSSPWWGSDAMTRSQQTGDYGAHCTTGPSLVEAGHTFVTTAAHCSSAIGDAVWNGPTRIGSVTDRRYANRGWIDTEIVEADTGPYLWVNWSTESDDCCFAHQNSLRYSEDAHGDYICLDGAVTRQECGIQVDETNQCIVFTDGHTTCDLSTTQEVAGSTAGPGDSGGPVYYGLSEDELRLHGTIVGGQESTGIVFFQRMVNIINYFGLQLQT